MEKQQWFDTEGKKHLQDFIKEILAERRTGTVNLERIMSEYASTAASERLSVSHYHNSRRTNRGRSKIR